MCSIALFVLVGFASVFVIKGKSENYFVAGRSLPLWVVTATLASQSLDSNAILGNVDLSYKYHFFDGAVLPIGLGLSLILNGLFLASKINADNALTLPDVFAKRYGKVVEIMVSICTIISFLCLLAGNLVGMGTIISYILKISQEGAIWVSIVVFFKNHHICTFVDKFCQSFLCIDVGCPCFALHHRWWTFFGGVYRCSSSRCWLDWMHDPCFLHDQ